MRKVAPVAVLFCLLAACSHKAGVCGTPGSPAQKGGAISKVEVMASNCDEVCTISLNGTNIAASSINDTTEVWIDISNKVYPVAGCNELHFVDENLMSGWTYGFHVRIDGVSAFDETCGERSRVGCKDNDLATGIVFDKTFTF